MLTLMALAAVADVVTMLALPPGGEMNPIGVEMLAAGLAIPLLAKFALTSGFVAAFEHINVIAEGKRIAQARHARLAVYGFATVAWSFGAITNLATVWR